MRLRLLLLVAPLLGVSSALACDIPNIGPEVFCGYYRAGPKTSFVKAGNGQLVAFEQYADVKALIAALPTDSSMTTGRDWSPAHAPKSRLTAERHNVEVTGYIVAVKPGEPDRDFHVRVGK